MTLNCRGQLIDLSTPKVMGILNSTPDSFYDGGKYTSEKSILNQVETMLEEGATFIDVGAYSSRPGADDISIEEEIDRAVPVVTKICQEFPEAIVSIDTFRSEVAQRCVEAGAVLINDISAGLLDPKMLATVAQLKVPYIMMHMKGTPQTMKGLSTYDNLIEEILYYFSERLNETKALQIKDVIIDPGFGFAKTITQNFELLNKLDLFHSIERPLLVGLSRKSMIYKTLETSPEDALNGTTALNSIALLKGANILRVHDVKEAVECVHLINKL